MCDNSRVDKESMQAYTVEFFSPKKKLCNLPEIDDALKMSKVSQTQTGKHCTCFLICGSEILHGYKTLRVMCSIKVETKLLWEEEERTEVTE